METSRQQRALVWVLCPVLLVWLLNGFYMVRLAQFNPAVFWLVDIAQWLFLPGGLLVWLARYADIRPGQFGYAWPIPNLAGMLRWAMLVFVTGYIAFATEKLFWYLFRYPTAYLAWPDIFPAGWAGTVIWLYSSLTAGFVESAFFISLPWLLYQRLYQQPSKDRFALLVSALFALAHWEQGAHIVASAFCFNYVMSAWFFELKTLWPIAIAHTGVDLIAFA